MFQVAVYMALMGTFHHNTFHYNIVWMTYELIDGFDTRHQRYGYAHYFVVAIVK